MSDFFESQLCGRNEQTCKKCRLSQKYRKGIIASFDNPVDVDFECPKGKSAKDFEETEVDIFSMAKGFTRAMVNEAKAVVNNQPRLPDSQAEERMKICRQCKFFSEQGQCSKCRCFMKFKTKLRTGGCPIGKW